MLITDSTLVGYTILTGTFRLQLALLAGCIFNVLRFPSKDELQNLNLTDSEQEFFTLSRLYYLPISHFLQFCLNIIQENRRLKLNRHKEVFAFAGTCIMVMTNLIVCNMLLYFPNHFSADVTAEMSATQVWLLVEWFFFTSTLFSNGLFLLLRSFFHHKVKVEPVPERMQLPHTDTIMTIQQIVNVFNSNYVPSIISIGLLFYLRKIDTLFLSIIVMCSVMSMWTVTVLIFVHWKKGSECWLRISESFMYTLLICNYISIPILIIATQAAFIVEKQIN
jgi:hypothetical protein